MFEERLEVWREREANPRAEMHTVVALDDGGGSPGDTEDRRSSTREAGLLGFACSFGAEDRTWETLLDNLHVSGDAEGRGLGRQLLAEAALWAERAYPDGGFYLWVLDKNTRARRFYEHLGATNEESEEIATPDGGMVTAPLCVAFDRAAAAVRASDWLRQVGRLMASGKMHADEIGTDVALVQRLLAAQFPDWASLPIEAVASGGTDNAIYRLGNELAVRLPRLARVTLQAEKEREWLPKLAPRLPLALPVPLGRGEPGEGYPLGWSIVPWLEGENATRERLGDPVEAARELAAFLVALRGIDAGGGPEPGSTISGVGRRWRRGTR